MGHPVRCGGRFLPGGIVSDTVKLLLEDIECDSDVQPRTFMDGEAILEYAEQMTEGVVFPPIVVFFDGKQYWCACGFHRKYAAEEAGFTHIEAEVRKGTKRDAMLFAVGTNAVHGMRRTNADKRRAVETLLRDKEWRGRDAKWIADTAQVGKASVVRWQNEWAKEKAFELPAKVTTRQGKVIPSRHKPVVLPGIEAKKQAYLDEVAYQQAEEPTQAPKCCPTCGRPE